MEKSLSNNTLLTLIVINSTSVFDFTIAVAGHFMQKKFSKLAAESLMPQQGVKLRVHST